MNSDEYRRFKDRSVKRWLGGLTATLVCANALVLGPCHVGDWLGADVVSGLKIDGSIWNIEQSTERPSMNSVNWNGYEFPDCKYGILVDECFR